MQSPAWDLAKGLSAVGMWLTGQSQDLEDWGDKVKASASGAFSSLHPQPPLTAPAHPAPTGACALKCWIKQG